jgi:UDP-N-acetylglucosamine 2-epimerase
MWNNVFPTKKPKDAFKYCLATVHRDFNVDDKSKLLQIMQALEESGENIELYLHPRTEKNIEKFKIKIGKNIKVLKPCSYKQMVNRMAFSKIVITDSGGLQLESYYLRRPSVVLRDDTEYWHSVESDWSQLVGSNKSKILEAIKKAHNGNGMLNYYGDGTAHKRIRLILNSL